MSATSGERGPQGRGTGLPCLVAALVALAVYVPGVWDAGFVNYDDPLATSAENPAVAGGLAGWLRSLWPFGGRPFMNAWLPAYSASLGIDHALFGADPRGWHLHSVLLHAACAAMVALLGRRLGLSVLAATVAGAAFAAHPAATESVAWVASRKDVLSFLWMSFAAWAYLEALRRGRPALHLAGAACLAVSLTAKGTTLVLPLLLAVHALLLADRALPLRRRLAPVVPYAVVAAVLTGVHFAVALGERTAAVGDASPARLLVADLEALGTYAALLLVPFPPAFRQTVEHGISAASSDGLAVALGAVALVAWTLALVRTWRSRPRVAAVLLAVPLALLPFNNVLPRTSVLFAERYAYVALLPVALAVGGLVASPIFLRGVALAAPAAYALLTWVRLPVWHDGVTLWEDAVEAAPDSALAHMQLADALADRVRRGGADADATHPRVEAAWREALRVADDELSRMRAESGLAVHFLTTAPPSGGDAGERLRECVALLESAERRLAALDVPGAQAMRATICVNRATARELLGETEEALADWRRAVAADESSAAAWNGLARAALAAGRGEDAGHALARSAALAPDDPGAARERARLLLATGHAAEAKGTLEAALAKHAEDFDLLVDAAQLDRSLQRPVDAEKKFRRALAARPGDASALHGLVLALLEQAQAQCVRDDLDASRATALAAAELLPESAAPQQILGIVARRANDLDEATVRFRRALELSPADARTREALASVLLERAVASFDAKEDAAGHALAEEAARVDARAVATRAARVESGVAGWPPAPPHGDERAVVARQAALRGLAYLAVGRAADAVPELVVAEHGTRDAAPAARANVLRLLVRARFLTGRADDAVAAAEELPSAMPGDLPWQGWAELAAALVERGIARRGAKDVGGAAADFDRARTLLDTAAAHGMPRSRRHLRRGEILFAEERFVDATREFDAAAEEDPRDPEPLLDRAAVWRTHFLLDEDRSYLDGAERDLRAALAVAPSDPRAMAALGEALVLGAKPNEAFPWLQRALLADPSQGAARRLLVDLAIRAGRSQLEKKELKEARAAAERAVALAVPSPEATLFLGDVLRAEGDWSRALAEYEKAAAEFPDRAEPRATLAKCYFDLGHVLLLQARWGEAAVAFRRARADDTGKVDLAVVDERLHEIAVSSFRQAMELREKGRLADAAKAFRASIAAEPTPEARFNLGVVLAQSDDFDGAAAAFADALAASPDDAAIRMQRALALFRAGRWEDAESDYRWVVENRPPEDATRAAAEEQLAYIADWRRSNAERAPR